MSKPTKGKYFSKENQDKRYMKLSKADLIKQLNAYKESEGRMKERREELIRTLFKRDTKIAELEEKLEKANDVILANFQEKVDKANRELENCDTDSELADCIKCINELATKFEHYLTL